MPSLRKGLAFAGLAVLALALPAWLLLSGEASWLEAIPDDAPVASPASSNPVLPAALPTAAGGELGLGEASGAEPRPASAGERSSAPPSPPPPPSPAAALPASPPSDASPAPQPAPLSAGLLASPAPVGGPAAAAVAPPSAPEALLRKESLQQRLEGSWFAWCHDGRAKNGQFWFLAGGKTKGDLKSWGLPCWKAVGAQEVVLDDCKGGNMHRLVFNCEVTGFFCTAGGQRGFIEGQGYVSPTEVCAPTSAEPPPCGAGATPCASGAPPMPVIDGGCNIFTLWEYPDGAPLFARLNLESWRRHSKRQCNEPILINNRNVRHYIPDMPEEYFRLPYVAARSDAIRYALLYHHGGIYFDSDFIVVEDLDPVIGRLQDHDLVSYADRADKDGSCGKFSSNFMGGRKGSEVHKKVWEAQKSAMRKHCPLKDKKKEKVCCFDDKTEVCHIPWAGLGEWIGHRELLGMKKRTPPPRTYCFDGDQAFVPPELGYVLGKNLNPQDALQFWARHGARQPLGRIMYHLFNAQFPFKDWSCQKLFNNKTAASFLYIRSFSTGYGRRLVPVTGATKDLYALHPVLQQHNVDYGNGRPCKDGTS